MTRKSKLYMQLDQLEGELKSRLIAAAQLAAAGSNGRLFVVSDLNPFPGYVRPTRETEEIVALGQQTLTLRRKLGESPENAPAAVFRRYCKEWSDASEHQRGACSTVARRLLVDLGAEPVAAPDAQKD